MSEANFLGAQEFTNIIINSCDGNWKGASPFPIEEGSLDKLTVIIGLGNPGNKYENTRHNVGFSAIDVISVKHGIKIDRLKHRALTGDGSIKGERVLLVKPQTFMNLSGESVRDIVEWYKLPMENIIVIYDDVDLPIGTVRIRPKGSSGTHNGIDR
jgi:PTH1 family peptidyl-tRNA hydrolase